LTSCALGGADFQSAALPVCRNVSEHRGRLQIGRRLQACPTKQHGRNQKQSWSASASRPGGRLRTRGSALQEQSQPANIPHCSSTWLRLVIAVYALAVAGVAANVPDIPVVTVCDVMSNMSAYNGRTVIVVGRYGHSMEGAWLDATCPNSIVENGMEWGNDIALIDMSAQGEPPDFPKRFRWNDRLLGKKVSELKPSTELRENARYQYRDEWAAVFGRFETRPLRSRADGYGHLAGSPARLVWPDNGVHIFHLRSERWVASDP